MSSSCRSAIIGGSGLTLNGSNDTVLVPKLLIDNTNVVVGDDTVIELIPGSASQVMSIIHNVPSSFFGETYSSAISFPNSDTQEGFFISYRVGDIYPNNGSEVSSVNLQSGGVNIVSSDTTTLNSSGISINANLGLLMGGSISGLQAVSGGGPVTISSFSIRTASKVFLTGMNGASDAWYVDNIVDGVSFDITALTTGGTGDVAWLIIN
jgi:hypothetical protein